MRRCSKCKHCVHDMRAIALLSLYGYKVCNVTKNYIPSPRFLRGWKCPNFERED